jgi:large subunit ribosomal protein L15
MASKAPFRSLQAIAQRSRICSPSTPSLAAKVAPTQAPKHFSTTTARTEELSERPRWSYTPEKMKAPFHPRIKDPKMAFTCNEDPNLLDAMYVKILGRGGEKVLPDEVKWLAITHKSFDKGRRGFNDKLAFFGMLFGRQKS